MSGAPETITEERLQEELMRLEAYRNQLSAILQQHEILSASRVEHLRARESLEGVDRSTPVPSSSSRWEGRRSSAGRS